MAGLTLEVAQNHLEAWLEAEVAVSTSQSYRIGTRSLTRADLSEISKRITYWQNQVDRLRKGRPRGIRALRVVPRDL